MDRGIDVRECFGPPAHRNRDWRTIWQFKDSLPRGSHYKTALAMDRSIAEQIIAQEDEDDELEPADPTPEGYTLDTYLLLAIIDALQGLQATVIAAAGADPPTVQPMPRPVTALDAVRDERRLNSMQDLIDIFSPRTDADQPPDSSKDN